MSRTLATKTQPEVLLQATRPVFVIELGFGTPLRLSTRETLNISGTVYTAAGLKVNPGRKSIELFNETFQYTATFKTVAGVSVRVWQCYGAAPFVTADLDMVMHGEIGPVQIGTVISFDVRPIAPQYTPRQIVAPSTNCFNYLHAATTPIATPTGTAPI